MNRQKASATAQKPVEGQEAPPEFCDEASEAKLVPSQFSFVCESLDGKLCLFEDADGHLAVVRTERLA